MRIAFDVDGVVLNSIEVILEHINELTGKHLTTSDLLDWELERLGVDIKTLWRAVEYMYRQPRIDPYYGALEALSRIYAETGEPLLFITGRQDPETALRQLEALEWNSRVPEMVVTGGTRDKLEYLIGHSVGFMVEDDVEHVESYMYSGIGVGLMVRPWNRQAEVAVNRRFRGWTDVEDWFADLDLQR